MFVQIYIFTRNGYYFVTRIFKKHIFYSFIIVYDLHSMYILHKNTRVLFTYFHCISCMFSINLQFTDNIEKIIILKIIENNY